MIFDALPATPNYCSQTQPATAPTLTGRILAVGLLIWWVVPFLFFFVVAAPVGLELEFRFGLKSGAMALVLAVLLAAFLRLASMGGSLWEIWQRRRRRAIEMEWALPNSERIRPVSIVMSVHGGREQVVETVDRLLALNYPRFEVIVVNDGSPDGTLACLTEAFSLHPTSRIIQKSIPVQAEPTLYASAKHPQLTVVAKPETGREDSLNCGLNVSRYPLVCALDSRITLDADALTELARGFIENVTQTVAVSCLAEFLGDAPTPKGSDICLSADEGVAPVRMAPRPVAGAAVAPSPLIDLQRIDRAALFHTQWLLRAGVGNVAMLPGVVSLLKKTEIVAAGGYRTGYTADTLDLLLTAYQVRKSDELRQVLFLPEIVAWIMPFNSLDEAMLARVAVTQESFSVIVRHLRLILRGQGDWRARLALPVFIVAVVFAPIWEWLAIVLVDVTALAGGITFDELVALLLMFAAVGLADSLGGLLCDEASNRRCRSVSEILHLGLAAIAHAITFRWMMGLAQLRGMLTYISGRSVHGTIPLSR